MKIVISFIMLSFSYSLMAKLDTDINNFETNVSKVKKIFCKKYEVSYGEGGCGVYTVTKLRNNCYAEAILRCNEKLDDIAKNGNLKIYKPVISKANHYTDIIDFNQKKFNSNLLKKCGGNVWCAKSLVDNDIAEELFDFCDSQYQCVSKLKHITELPKNFDRKKLNECLVFDKSSRAICVTNIISSQEKVSNKISQLEFDLYKCHLQLTGHVVNTDLHKIEQGLLKNKAFKKDNNKALPSN